MKRLLPFVVVAVTLGPFCQRSPAEDKPEPRYEGKPLKYWVERLRKAENDADRSHAVQAVVAFGPDAAPAAPELVQMLDDRSKEFRSYVGEILHSMGAAAKSTTPELIRLLKEKTARDPNVVIYVLGGIGSDAKEAVPVLTAILADHERTALTMNALCLIGPLGKEIVPALRQGIQDARANGKEIEFDYDWIEPMAKLGEDAVPLLLEFLGQNEPRGKQYSAETLGMIGPPAKKASPALTNELKHNDADVRLAAARALWLIEKNPKVIPVLSALLVNRYRPAVVEAAAKTLGEIGPPAKSAIPALERVIPNAEDWVKATVIEAIRKIDPEAAQKLPKP